MGRNDAGRLTLRGSAEARIANSIANSNPLRSDMIGILPRGDYPIFSGGPNQDFCSLPLSDHSGPRTFWHVRTSTQGRRSPLRLRRRQFAAAFHTVTILVSIQPRRLQAA